jgi:spore coat protein U-like protein
MRSMNLRTAVVAFGTVFAMGLAADNAAAQTTANLAVSATVANNCTIGTAPLNFGSYDPIGAHAASPLDGTGTVTIACTKGAAATIGLGLGSNASGSVRRMSNGTEFLTYELYKEAARTNVWANAGADLFSAGAAPSKAPRNFTVYGRVAGNQDVASGTYNDTVVATVNF